MTEVQVFIIARAFHEAYERLAPSFGWETQPGSRTIYRYLPKENRALMEATVRSLLTDHIIEPGERARMARTPNDVRWGEVSDG